jgi:hypothetical protein
MSPECGGEEGVENRINTGVAVGQHIGTNLKHTVERVTFFLHQTGLES